MSGVVAGGQGGQGQNTTGNMGDAVQFGTLAGTLVVDPGAVFKGDVVANAAVRDTLQLAGGEAGSLTGLGTRITGLTKIDENAHATWTLTGSISGTGSILIGTGATLSLDGSVNIASIAFAPGGDARLELGAPTQVTSTLVAFAAGDVIDLKQLQVDSLSYANGTLTLYRDGVVDTLRFAGTLTKADFGLRSDGNYGTDVVFKTNPAATTVPASGANIFAPRDMLTAVQFAVDGHMHLPL